MSRGRRSARPPGSRVLRRKSRLVYSEIPLIAIPTCSSTYPLQRYPRPTLDVTIPFKDIFVLDRSNHSPCTILYVSSLVVSVPNANRSTHRVVPPTPVASPRDKWVTVCDGSRLACACLRRAPIRGCGLFTVASLSFITTTTTWAFAHVYLGPLLLQY